MNPDPKNFPKEPAETGKLQNRSVSGLLPRRKFLRKFLGGCVALTIAGGAGYHFWRERRELSEGFRLPDKTPNRKDIEERISQYYQTLTNDLEIVWLETKPKLAAAFDTFQRELTYAGEQFSKEQINRRAIAGLIIDMARDRLDNGVRAELWFEENLSPYLQPVFHRLERRLQRAEREFEEAATRAIGLFAEKTTALLQAEGIAGSTTLDSQRLEEKTRQAFAFRGLQFGAGTGLGIGLTLVGATGYLQATLFATILRRVKQSLVYLLRPIARQVAVRMGASLLTAKVPPLSLIIMALGSATTAYEVIRLRDRARQDFETALKESLGDMEDAFAQNVKLPFIQRLAHFQENANPIKEAIVREIL